MAMSALGPLLRPSSLASLVTVGLVLALAVSPAAARHLAPGGCSLVGWEPHLCARSTGNFPPARTLPRGREQQRTRCRGIFVLIWAWFHPAFHLVPSREDMPVETLSRVTWACADPAPGPRPHQNGPGVGGIVRYCLLNTWMCTARWARWGRGGRAGPRRILQNNLLASVDLRNLAQAPCVPV